MNVGQAAELSQRSDEITELGEINPGDKRNDIKGTDPPTETTSKLRDKSSYGSATRRAGRNIRKGREVPRIRIPDWFLERNITLYEERVHDKELRELESTEGAQPIKASPKLWIRAISGRLVSTLEECAVPGHSVQGAASRSSTTEGTEGDYEVDADVVREIDVLVTTGLRPSSTHQDVGYAASKPHLLLQCPSDGGITFLDTVVNYVVSKHKADLIAVDAQDIAQIAEEFTEEIPDGPNNSLRSLAYDTHLILDNQTSRSDEEVEETNEYEEDQEEDETQPRGSKQPSYQSNIKHIAPTQILFLATPELSNLFKSAKGLKSSTSQDAGSLTGGTPATKSRLNSGTEPQEVKPHMVLEAFVDACHAKRRQLPRLAHARTEDEAPSISNTTNTEGSSNEKDEVPSKDHKVDEGAPPPLILLIRDYAEMNATQSGGAMLRRLHEIVRQRRRDGQKTLIIGTTSSEDLVPSMSKAGFTALQTEPSQGPYRTIIVPCRSQSAMGLLASDLKIRNKAINIRNLQNLLRKLSSNPSQVETIVSLQEINIDASYVFASGLDEHIWSFERINRTATMALGLLIDKEEMSALHIGQALHLIDLSDNAKFDWLAKRKEDSWKVSESAIAASSSDPRKPMEDRINKLRKKCNTHERRLLNGVVDAASIRTTFADVHAASSTIEALKTLTSLSLTRPEAFSYGVLATDKIPGLLLYGPPGTGKTLLAKAVAKESGATVLEVSGSDVYDMYVGEGEKNVKAIFTLAKKLTPCIVFIDEADAIFGSRGSLGNRTSHRELINQFLREWDGMNDLSAFIMVATNRPFDLDDAVLRRLPRRLLVDLPTEKDREAILRIHLQNEVLDPAVSLSTIASQTPFYSGSDLKNLCVAAALACIREENAAAVAHTGSEPYIYPEKRCLTERHFDKAMEEISASISEDMSSLSAIRKFDEKYGDRKGRRKRSSGYGFGTLSDIEKNQSDAVRVRAPS